MKDHERKKMKHYLKNNDEIVTDNVKLVYENGQFKSTEGSLAHANMYVYDEETEQEYEIQYEMIDSVLTPYYEKPFSEDTNAVLKRGWF